MLPDLFQVAFADDLDVPALEATDHVLVRWLRRRLGRPPSWLEVLAFRAGLRERARRLARWTWWRRLSCPAAPRREDLIVDFLRSGEGQILFRLVGGMTALLAQLVLSDPWAGFDGRHPYTPRLSRKETLRERVAGGCSVPMREQAMAVLTYTEWKLSGLPMMAQDGIPEAAEFLAPVHAAAINAMTAEAAMGICARLRPAGSSEVGRRAVLRELDRAGGDALRLWPDIGRRGPEAPSGIWPPPEDDDGPAVAPLPMPLPPSGFVP
jgi:hypothetical protein